MNGRFPAGIRMVLSDCAGPEQETAFNEWYDNVHLPDMLASGLVVAATRYRRADPRPGEAAYLAIYDVEREDLEETGRAIAAHADGLREQGRLHTAVRPVDRMMWRRIGGEPRSDAVTQPVAGIFMVESNPAAADREEEFNRWYDEVHVPDLLSLGLFHTAYRFAAVVPSPGRGRYLAIYETHMDPVQAVSDFTARHRPRLKDAGRFSDAIQVTGRGIFARLSAIP